jgi:hypothetical protein
MTKGETITQEVREKQSETDCFEHKKREPLIGSLVTNTIKYTLFLPKNQVLTRVCPGMVHRQAKP